MDKEEIEDRHRELSLMLYKMGSSLVKEGLDNKDYTIGSVGNSLVFVASLALNITDLKQFSSICAMMSAKQMIRSIQDGTIDKEAFDKLFWGPNRPNKNDFDSLDEFDDDK